MDAAHATTGSSLSDIIIAEVKTDFNVLYIEDSYTFDENQYLFRNFGSGENSFQKRLIAESIPVIRRGVYWCS